MAGFVLWMAYMRLGLRPAPVNSINEVTRGEENRVGISEFGLLGVLMPYLVI